MRFLAGKTARKIVRIICTQSKLAGPPSLPRGTKTYERTCKQCDALLMLSRWLYRKSPSVARNGPFTACPHQIKGADREHHTITPNQLRWDPFPISNSERYDFLDGLSLVAEAGDASMRSGVAIYIYTCSEDMKQRALYNSDGDFLLVPQQGAVLVTTELGQLLVEPNEIAVIPRGFLFKVQAAQGADMLRGYVLEVYDGHFELPDLGPIGANGLANPQDFAYPTAATEDCAPDDSSYTILNKFMGTIFTADRARNPFNVVAWRGNYAPFKYNLRLFNTINTVSFDHPDPSIFTVLTCKSTRPGTAIADFVIFPPRWMVAEHTFRPPYFHRNAMTEFMGLIEGVYDAKTSGGFLPGGASLHSLMTAHGPDLGAFTAATKAPLGPVKVAEGQMAFMFETSLMLKVSNWAAQSAQPDYQEAAWLHIPAVEI